MINRILILGAVAVFAVGLAYFLAGNSQAGDGLSAAERTGYRIVSRPELATSGENMLAATARNLPTAIPALDQTQPASFETASFALG